MFPVGTIVQFIDPTKAGGVETVKITGVIDRYETNAVVSTRTDHAEYAVPIERLHEINISELSDHERERLLKVWESVKNSAQQTNQQTNQQLPIGTFVRFTTAKMFPIPAYTFEGVIVKYKPVAIVKSGTLGLRKFETPKEWTIETEKLERIINDNLKSVKQRDPSLRASHTVTNKGNTSWIRKRNNTPNVTTAPSTPAPTAPSTPRTNANNTNNNTSIKNSALKSAPNAAEPWEKSGQKEKNAYITLIQKQIHPFGK